MLFKKTVDVFNLIKCRISNRFVVVSFPKSGRTWLRVMLDEAGCNNIFYTHDQSDYQLGLHYNALVKDKKKYKKKNVILLIRDPRDTVVSGYFQATKRLNIYSDELSNLIREPEYGIEKIINFNLDWFIAAKTMSRIMIVKYEDLHTEIHRQMPVILNFLGCEGKSDEEIEKIISIGNFDVMRKREKLSHGHALGKALEPKDPGDLDSFKTRRGKVGGFVDYLSLEDIAFCDSLLAKYSYWTHLQSALDEFGVKSIK